MQYVDGLSTKICIPNKTKDINVKAFNMTKNKNEEDVNVKVFNMTKNKNEAKTVVKHIKCDCNCKCNTCTCKKVYGWDPSTCICENGKYSKSFVDNSKIKCDEFMYAMDIVSTNMTNTISTDMSTNFDGKKKRIVIFYTHFC